MQHISEADIVPNRADGYDLVNGALKNQEWVAPTLNTTADGARYLTVLDMAKWDAALYTEKLLKRSSLGQMWTSATLKNGEATDYGFAGSVGERKGARFVRHNGAWQGFTADITRYPDRKLTVIVLANSSEAGPSSIADEIVGLYETDLAPIKRTAVSIDPKVFDAYVGRYQINPKFFISVTREGEHYFVQATDQGRIEIFPESEMAFFATVVDVVFTFAKNSSGAVTHFTLRQDDEDTEAKKVG